MRFAVAAVLCGVSVGAWGQGGPLSRGSQGAAGMTQRIEVPANVIIPKPPPSAPIADWTSAAGRETVSMQVGADTLRGYRYAGKDADAPLLVFFNGNGMTVERGDPLYRALAALGPTVVAYDYRGYGFSTGTADVDTFLSDGLRIYDALLAAQTKHNVLVYGYSMGTTVATSIASKREVRGLILAAAIASADEEFPIFAKAMGMAQDRIDAEPSQGAAMIFHESSLIKKSHAPLLLLHGDADTLVPIKQGHEIFDASKSASKTFVIVPGAGHNETTSRPIALEAVGKFLKTLY